MSWVRGQSISSNPKMELRPQRTRHGCPGSTSQTRRMSWYEHLQPKDVHISVTTPRMELSASRAGEKKLAAPGKLSKQAIPKKSAHPWKRCPGYGHPTSQRCPGSEHPLPQSCPGFQREDIRSKSRASVKGRDVLVWPSGCPGASIRYLERCPGSEGQSIRMSSSRGADHPSPEPGHPRRRSPGSRTPRE